MLLVCLLGTAFSTSSNMALSHPQKIETWLDQSNLYQHFVSNAIDQAKKSAGSSEDQGSVTLSDSAVQQAADSAFTTQIFQQSLNTFLNSNYAWLEGKTAQPNFTIDLTSAKQNFAAQIGQYVQEHISSLPVCTTQQLVEIGSAANIDPLNITCRPPTLDAQAEATLVTQKVENSGGFLSNPVITANNINPKGSSSQPYYQKFSEAPKLYRLAVKLPWIYAAVALISALGVLFLAPRKRWGLRRVGITLAVAGAVLIISVLLSNTALHQAEKRIFNQSSVGQLQQSLTNFLSQLEHQLVKVDLWFGIGYLGLAAIIFILLASTRRRKHRPETPVKPIPPGDSESLASRLSNTPREAPKSAPEPPRPAPTGPPPPPKRPTRLIQ